MVRANVIKKVGMLDEDFLCMAEDIDWCYRIKKQDWKIMFSPKTSFLHRKNKAGEQIE